MGIHTTNQVVDGVRVLRLLPVLVLAVQYTTWHWHSRAILACTCTGQDQQQQMHAEAIAADAGQQAGRLVDRVVAKKKKIEKTVAFEIVELGRALQRLGSCTDAGRSTSTKFRTVVGTADAADQVSTWLGSMVACRTGSRVGWVECDVGEKHLPGEEVSVEASQRKKPVPARAWRGVGVGTRNTRSVRAAHACRTRQRQRPRGAETLDGWTGVPFGRQCMGAINHVV